MATSYYIKKNYVSIPYSGFFVESNPLCDFQIIYRDYINEIKSADKSEALKDIVTKRFNQGMILNEIGKHYGFTRERARQIVARFKGHMRSLYEGRKIKHPHVTLKKEYFNNNHKFIKFLSEKPFHTEKEIKDHINNDYNLSATNYLIKRFLEVYLYIFDFNRTEVDDNVIYYNTKEIAGTKEIFDYYQTIEKYLRRNILGDTAENISKSIDIPLIIVEPILSVMTDTIEIINSGTYRIRPHLITGLDAAYRVFTEKNKPLHLKVLDSELKALGVKLNTRSLSSRLANDDRFKPIGKKSIFSLTIWNEDCRTYLEIMRDILKGQKKPLRSKEIKDLSGGLLKLDTIASYIQEYPQIFKKTRSKLIALTEWKRYKRYDNKRDIKKYLTRKTLINITLDFFKEKREKEAKVKEYYAFIKSKVGPKSYNYLFSAKNRCPIISCDTNQNTVKLKDNYKDIIRAERRDQEKKDKKSYDGVKKLAVNIVRDKGSVLIIDIKNKLLDTGASEPLIYKVLCDPCFSKKKQGNTRILSISKKN